MANNTGLLEGAFAEVLQRASDTDVMTFGHPHPDAMPDDAPRTEVEVLQRCLDVYREYQTFVDAACRGAATFLETPEGVADVQAFGVSWADGEPTELGRSIADRILASDALRPMQTELKGRDYAAAGVGVAGSFVPKFIGLGIGFEYLYTGEPDIRFWADVEAQFMTAITVGLSFSVWKYTPLNGFIYGFVVELPYPTNPTFTMRWMLYFQREQATKKIRFFGAEVQLGVGRVSPIIIAGGIFFGWQIAKKRKTPRVTLAVENSQTGTNTLTVATSTSLDVTITAGADLMFDSGTIMRLNLPNFFTEDEVAAMSVSGAPGYWDVSIDGQNILLTASESYTWYAGQTAKFTIENVESAGDTGQSSTVTGVVTLTGNPTTKVPLSTYADLYLAVIEYDATVNWTATPGDGGTSDLTLGGVCANVSPTCTGGPIDASAQGGNTVSYVVAATDSDGNTWQLGPVQSRHQRNVDRDVRKHERVYDLRSDGHVSLLLTDRAPCPARSRQGAHPRRVSFPPDRP
jgi:hypothetical protein